MKLAPPVMLAQLIQALYNIVDSLFVGRYSDSGLAALSIVYPFQLLMIALAVGTGVGIIGMLVGVPLCATVYKLVNTDMDEREAKAKASETTEEEFESEEKTE